MEKVQENTPIVANIIQKEKNMNFPQRLFWLLGEDCSKGIMEWTSDNKSFRIIDIDRLISEILPLYFKSCKMASFQRQLNLYGFRRVIKGAVAGVYSHPKFICGERDLALQIRRASNKSNQTKKIICGTGANPPNQLFFENKWNNNLASLFQASNQNSFNNNNNVNLNQNKLQPSSASNASEEMYMRNSSNKIRKFSISGSDEFGSTDREDFTFSSSSSSSVSPQPVSVFVNSGFNGIYGDLSGGLRRLASEAGATLKSVRSESSLSSLDSSSSSVYSVCSPRKHKRADCGYSYNNLDEVLRSSKEKRSEWEARDRELFNNNKSNNKTVRTSEEYEPFEWGDLNLICDYRENVNNNIINNKNNENMIIEDEFAFQQCLDLLLTEELGE